MSSTANVVVLGESATAKEAVVRALHRAAEQSGRTATIASHNGMGSEHSMRIITNVELRHDLELRILTQPASPRLVTSALPAACGALLVYQTDNYPSFAEVKSKWMSVAEKSLPGGSFAILLGYASGASKVRAVTIEEAEKFATRQRLAFMELSEASQTNAGLVLRLVTSKAMASVSRASATIPDVTGTGAAPILAATAAAADRKQSESSVLTHATEARPTAVAPTTAAAIPEVQPASIDTKIRDDSAPSASPTRALLSRRFADTTQVSSSYETINEILGRPKHHRSQHRRDRNAGDNVAPAASAAEPTVHNNFGGSDDPLTTPMGKEDAAEAGGVANLGTTSPQTAKPSAPFQVGMLELPFADSSSPPPQTLFAREYENLKDLFDQCGFEATAGFMQHLQADRRGSITPAKSTDFLNRPSPTLESLFGAHTAPVAVTSTAASVPIPPPSTTAVARDSLTQEQRVPGVSGVHGVAREHVHTVDSLKSAAARRSQPKQRAWNQHVVQSHGPETSDREARNRKVQEKKKRKKKNKKNKKKGSPTAAPKTAEQVVPEAEMVNLESLDLGGVPTLGASHTAHPGAPRGPPDLIIEVEIDPQTAAKSNIEYRKGDRPRELADAFVRQHGLKLRKVPVLAELVQRRIAEAKELQKRQKLAAKVRRSRSRTPYRKTTTNAAVPTHQTTASIRPQRPVTGSSSSSARPIRSKLRIVLGAHDAGTIVVREGDTADVLLQRFVSRHQNLRDEQIDQIRARLNRQLASTSATSPTNQRRMANKMSALTPSQKALLKKTLNAGAPRTEWAPKAPTARARALPVAATATTPVAADTAAAPATPVFHLDLQLEDGSTAHITMNKGDEPRTVAENLVASHGLPPLSVPLLSSFLAEKLQVASQ